MSAKGFGFERCTRMAAAKIRQTLQILREDSQLEGANSLFAALAPGLAPNAQVRGCHASFGCHTKVAFAVEKRGLIQKKPRKL